VVSNTSLSVNGTLKDKDASVGTAGQILSSTGTKVQWIDLPIYAATSPLSINNITKTISIQKAGSTQDGYLSSADWISFAGKQDAISLTTVGSSGPSTLIGTTINVPNYTLAGLGGVPQTRTLTINGVTYNLAADRTWTIAAGVSSVTATSPLFSTGGVNPDISIQKADSSLDGYLSSADWITFNDKQPAGNYITSLTGEATGVGPGASAITLSNSAVIGKLLTGLNITGGTVVSTDSILIAFGKVQNQINSLVGGVIYKGVWNAATNTPTLTSSVGTQGNYYIVNVAGSTNLNGITDWNVGDWAIFNGSTWNKVDNTDSVTSVNGQTGAVSLTTDNIPEGTTNLYFLNSRARAALSFAAGSGAYNSTTGVITIPTDNSQILNGAGYITLGSLSASSPLSYNSLTGAFAIQVANSTQNGYLSSTDWNTFNSKQAFLNGTGLVKSVAGTISYITDNSTNWNTAYDNMIVSAAVTGTATKTLTLTQQDAGTITASWTDNGLTSVGVSMPSAFSVANSPLTSNGTIAITGAGSALQYIDGTGALQTFPTIATEAATLVTEVYNETGATLTKGTIVYINGGHGNLPTVTKALATSDATSAQTYGVVQQDITNMNNGHVVVIGSLGDLDTQAYANGTILYLSSTTAGTWTSVKQYAPAHLVYVGIVVRSHPTQGVVEVKIQNGYELDELHNVSAQTPSNGNILQYVSSTQLWTAVAGTTTNIAEGTNLYYLDSRARAALSFTAGSGAYNSTTGVITIPTNTNQLTNGAAFITLGSLSATAPLSYNNLTGVFSISQAGTASNGYLSSTDWNTFNSKQEVISLTTIGSSGASTLVGTTLNVPNYTLSGLGGVPTSRTLNINGTSYDLSTDRSWSVGTVTSVSALTLGTTGTDLSSTVATGTTTPVITLNVPTASATNRGALSSTDWSTFNGKVGGVTASSPLSSSGGTTPNITIQVASGSQNGYLSSTDWTTFNNKQAAGNYITSLTGEATASGPGAASVTLSNSAVTAKVLTGINITGGTVLATDSILTGFGKLQNQINGLIGSTIYQGTWNASTNTPTLTSSVGTRGWYYIVSVAGTTNLNGITDWQVGDWAIFDGTAWQKVDNTDAVVSVNGQTGAVSLTTDNIPEGTTNLYYTNTRARAALSFTAGSGAYNSTTGVITIPTNTSQLTNGANFITLASLSGVAPIGYNSSTGAISITQAGTASNGYLSSTDWNTFNNKQNALTNPVTGTGTTNYLPKFTGASTIGNSIAYDGGSSIGINTNAPYDSTQFKLDVNGGFIVKNTSGTAAQFVLIDANPASGGNAGFFIQSVGGTSTAAWAQIQTYYGTSIAAGALRLQPNGGQVLIGTTTTSTSFMLDVNGSFRTTSNVFADGGTILLKQGVGSTTATGYLSLSGSTGTGTGVIVVGLGGTTSSSLSFPTSSNYSYLFPSASGTIALVGGAGVGTVTNVAALTIGTTGTDLSSTVTNSTTTPVITLNVPTASATNRGALSAADWTTFNNKQAAGNYVTTDTTQSISGLKTFTSVITSTVSAGDSIILNKTTGPQITLNKTNATAQSWGIAADPNFRIINITLGNNALSFDFATNAATLSNLSGTGTRMVVTDASGVLSTQAIPTGTVTGTGLANYVTKWVSTSVLGYGIIYDNGTTAMIGTTTASSFNDKFKVVGSVSTNGLVRFENAVNQGDLNHGTLEIVNTAAYAIGNDASISFALNRADNSYQDPRASIGAKTESSYGGALVFNTRSDIGTYSEKLRITGAGPAIFSSSVTTGNGIISNYGRINGRFFITDEASYGDMTSTTGMISIGYYPAGQEATIRSRNYTTATNTKLAFDASQFTFSSTIQTAGNISIYTAGYPALNLGINSSNQFTWIYDNPNSQLLLQYNGGTRFTMSSGGAAIFSSTLNVGGVTDIQAARTVQLTLLKLSTTTLSSANNDEVSIDFGRGGMSRYSGRVSGYLSDYSTYDGGLKFYTSTAGTLNATAALILTSTNSATFSGSVGIGTGPSYRLDVYSGSSGVVLNLQGVDAYNAETGILMTSGRAKISGFLNPSGGTPGSSLRFYTMPDGGSVSETLRITSSGNFGFNNPSPNRHYVFSNPNNKGAEGFEINAQSGIVTFLSYNRATSTYLPISLSEGSSNVLIGTVSDAGYKLQVAGTSTFSGQMIQGGGAPRSTNGITVALTYNTAWTANSDPGDGGRFLSIVNDSSVANAYSALSFRVYPSGGSNNAMLDMKFVNANSSNASTLYWSFLSGGSWYDRMSVTSGGTLTLSGDVVAYGSPSDSRLKIIKEKVPNALASVLKLNGYKFDWKKKDGLLNIKEDIGVIAQEVAELFPELARTNADGNMSVRYQGLTAVLIEAIKEQQKQIEELKKQLA
jgi:hypothetical protein